MTKDKKDLDIELNDLRKELETIKNSVEKITRGDLAAVAYDNIEEMVSPIMRDLNKFLKRRKEEFCEAKERCEERISANPFLSIFGALAVGALVGMLLKKVIR